MEEGNNIFIKELFGGALTCGIHRRFIDVSDFRQVPDNQEVFNDVECDQTIIVELLEATEEPAIKDAVVHHFQEMASLNEARQSEVVAVEELTDQDLPHLKDFPKAFVYGQQEVAKFNEEAGNRVDIFLCVVRLEKVNTDLVVSLSSGIAIHPESSSAPHTHHTESIEQKKALFKSILLTLAVHDWGLFG